MINMFLFYVYNSMNMAISSMNSLAITQIINTKKESNHKAKDVSNLHQNEGMGEGTSHELK